MELRPLTFVTLQLKFVKTHFLGMGFTYIQLHTSSKVIWSHGQDLKEILNS
jgi:hypothetical protein